MKNEGNAPRLGLDIGRVIMAPVKNGRADTSFLTGSLARAMATPPTKGAIVNIQRLVEAFQGRVWLVSKAGQSVQRKTRLWLRRRRFFEETGIPRDNLRFCLRREQKAIHCRQNRLTHFVDDRLDVLCHLRSIVPNLYLFGEQFLDQPDANWVVPVLTWDETTTRILETV